MKQSEWKKIFTFAVPYLRRQWRSFAAVMAILMLGGIITSFTPYIWGEILDNIAEGRVQELATWLGLYFLITYVAMGMSIVEGYLGSKMNYAAEAEIKQKLMEKALHMRCSDLDQFDAGTLVSRVTSDSSAVISFVFEVITSIVMIVINVAAALLFVFYISAQLSFVSLAFIPLSIGANFIFKKAFRALSKLQRVYGDKLSSFLVGTLSHIPEMKAYCLERAQSRQYSDLIWEGWSLQKKQFVLSTKTSLVSSLIGSASTAAVLLLSTALIAQGRFTIGSMVSFQRYIDQLTGAVSSLLQMNYSAQSAGVAVDRMMELFSMEEEKGEDGSAPLKVLSIAFQDVSFTYREEENVLAEIRFSIDKPGLYALVGENGSGKTTVLKLLMRYYAPSAGHISLNGQDITSYSTETVRRNIGYYAKDVYIKDGTILANLLLGSRYTPETPPSHLDELCEKAGLRELISSLPDGLCTLVGENGKLLSSGQKQKIAVVRALLDDSSLLLLDEITSDLDGEAEEKIVSALAELGRKKIVLLVTHRVVPLQSARQAVVLEAGRVAAIGEHGKLLETSSVYWSLFKKQS